VLSSAHACRTADGADCGGGSGGVKDELGKWNRLRREK
jgi:hypothetical protein